MTCSPPSFYLHINDCEFRFKPHKMDQMIVNGDQKTRIRPTGSETEIRTAFPAVYCNGA